ncbi:MAG: hypothetical protein LAP87_00650 [Acidobacteriia bacterium]|nr:hypothetical protein [Terriglobia bacterium]
MTRSVRVHALVRAAAAFLAALMRRPPEAASSGVQDAPRAALSSGLRSAGVENRCPVCQARFRGVRICSRCGADLEPLMRLAVQAWQLRQTARQALDAGDVERALVLASEAQAIQDTERGGALRLLGAWLKGAGAASTPSSEDIGSKPAWRPGAPRLLRWPAERL